MAIIKTILHEPYYAYAHEEFVTMDAVNVKVLDVKDKLDNKPTTFCTVKRLTPLDGGKYQVPSEGLSDADIMSLDSDGFFKVSSELFGTNYDTLTAEEANSAVQTEKLQWAQAKAVNTICPGRLVRQSEDDPSSPLYGVNFDIFEEVGDYFAPSNVDMSGYV